MGVGPLEDICYFWVSIIRYKTIVDSKKKTRSGASSWVFFSSMENILNDDPSVEPVLIVSSFAGDNLFHVNIYIYIIYIYIYINICLCHINMN